jgi:hypothetical protein
VGAVAVAEEEEEEEETGGIPNRHPFTLDPHSARVGRHTSRLNEDLGQEIVVHERERARERERVFGGGGDT